MLRFAQPEARGSKKAPTRLPTSVGGQAKPSVHDYHVSQRVRAVVTKRSPLLIRVDIHRVRRLRHEETCAVGIHRSMPTGDSDVMAPSVPCLFRIGWLWRWGGSFNKAMHGSLSVNLRGSAGGPDINAVRNDRRFGYAS